MPGRISWLPRAACASAMCVFFVSTATADTFGSGGNQFTIDFVTISGATNPGSGYGIVNNDYRIGVYEITNSQWGRFRAALGVPVVGNPTNAYDKDSYWTSGSMPTNAVSWYEAAQFVNWLNTSTGHQAAYKFTGTQGTSNYTLATWSPAEADNGTNLFRHKDALYYLPTEDEWVKAGYWNGTTLQTYATPDDTKPVEDVETHYDYEFGTKPWGVGQSSRELNGTYDMMGNVFEWMESPYDRDDYRARATRGLRGGSYNSVGEDLMSNDRGENLPADENITIGFRVASEAPEPATLSLLALGGIAMLKRRRKG